MRRLLSSTVAGLVLAIFLAQLVSTGTALYFLRAQMASIIHQGRTREVLDVRDDLLAAYYDGGGAELRQYIAARQGSADDPAIFIALLGNGPTLLNNLVQAPANVPSGNPARVKVTQQPQAPPIDALAVSSDLSDGSRLIVGTATESELHFDIAFAEAIGLTIALTVLIALSAALTLGYVISRRTHAIAETAEALAEGDFAARVPRENVGDGFDHLRRQMNLMAERIDVLVGELRGVAGSLAHDLRSPVARLSASIDTAAMKVPEGPAADALQLARQDADALEAMLTTALELSRLESATVADRRSLLDLGAVCADIAELYEPLAEQSGIELQCSTAKVEIRADREMVSRALSNLIDNAIKYGGDRIDVACYPAGDGGEVTVIDNGPGIAEADRARAVTRFSRLDNARTRPGAGLGLAMVAAVARLHGGKLDLSGRPDGQPGLVTVLHLPHG
ncbi:HAMP domain-containing sensor histidine kinase [Novosphingobium sp. ZN18A2]|uniref:sensor histidine kinase n=1 Tax=Novosphingobium sp. ZN18A2 TaxID=3079861 RepID=UPI0030D52172